MYCDSILTTGDILSNCLNSDLKTTNLRLEWYFPSVSPYFDDFFFDRLVEPAIFIYLSW